MPWTGTSRVKAVSPGSVQSRRILLFLLEPLARDDLDIVDLSERQVAVRYGRRFQISWFVTP